MPPLAPVTIATDFVIAYFSVQVVDLFPAEPTAGINLQITVNAR
jgi:hypothetical protein